MNRTKRSLCDILDAYDLNEERDHYIPPEEALKQRDEEYRQELLIGLSLPEATYIHNTSIAIH